MRGTPNKGRLMSYKQKIKEVREKRNTLIKQARDINDRASNEKRELRSDESEQYERLMREVESLRAEMERMRDLDDAGDKDDKDDDKGDDDSRDDGDDKGDDDSRDDDKADDDDKGDRGNPRRKGSKRNKPRTQPGGNGDNRRTDQRNAFETEQEFRTRQRRSSPEYRSVFWNYMANGSEALNSTLGRRAIQADSDIVGGYLVAPQEFTSQLIKFVDNLLWIRQRATKYTLKSAQSLGAPSLDTDISDADWTSELDTGNEDTSMAFGKRELYPRPLAKRLKISNKLLRMASIQSGASADGSVATGGPENLIRNRLGYKFAVTEEKAFLTGNGTNQPLGVFTASSRGISTARDYSTNMTTTNFSGDALLGAKYAMKAQYWPELEWLFHRDALLKISQLKDANNQYLWVPNGYNSPKTFSDGAGTNSRNSLADSLLGFPVMSSEYVPNTFTTGLYVGLLGAFSFYWIADAETLQIQRLVELYAAANQTGFIARQEIDGMPVLEEAFLRLKTS